MAPDGTLYILNYSSGGTVYRVGTDDVVFRHAGGGATGSTSNPPNNIRARDANLSPAWGGVAVDASGAVCVRSTGMWRASTLAAC